MTRIQSIKNLKKKNIYNELFQKYHFRNWKTKGIANETKIDAEFSQDVEKSFNNHLHQITCDDYRMKLFKYKRN